MTPPTDQLVLSRQLLTPHRNCHEIRQLHMFLQHHSEFAHLSPAEDVPAPLLPRGRLPLWVQKTEEESYVSVLEMLKEEYTNSLSVTVIHGDGLESGVSEEIRVWCEGQDWRYVEEDRIHGSEDQCVVLMGGSACYYPESISRGRNLLVVVTSREVVSQYRT